MDDKNKSTVGSVLDKIRNGDANSTLEQVKVRYNNNKLNCKCRQENQSPYY
jgi:hypothetical protein